MLEKGYYKDKKDRCFILGTGPSINDIDLSYLDSEAEILIKNFHENLENNKIILEKKSINSYESGFYINNYLKILFL